MDATVVRESIQAVEEKASLISTVKQAGEIYLYFSQWAFMSEPWRCLRAKLISNSP